MDSTNLIITLVLNASLLLALNTLHEISYQLPGRYAKVFPYLNGVLIALIGLAIMSIPFRFANGVFFDTRTILLSVSALVFGPVPAVIATVILSVYRLFLGGIGAPMGVATMLGSMVLGLAVRHFLYHGKVRFRWIPMYMFGFGIHLYMLGCTVLLPATESVAMLRAIALPVLLVYPAGSVLLSLTLLHQQERKESVEQLREAESRYRSLFENARAVMLLLDPASGSIVDANQTAQDFYGWSIGQLRGMALSQVAILPAEELQAEMLKAAVEQRSHFLLRHRKADGSIADVEVYSSPIRIQGRTLLFSIVHDITDRVANEQARRESESRFQTVVEGSPLAIYIQLNQRFAYVNPATIRMYRAKSADDLVGTKVIDRFHPEVYDRIMERLQMLNIEKASVPILEEPHLRLDGTWVDCELTAVPIRYDNQDGSVVFLLDVSERKRLEAEKIQVDAQLRQRQKLEAIGTLAGGVAHEINNPINGILNYAQLILDELDRLQKPHEQLIQIEEYAQEILHESDRVSNIIRGLLQFSRQERQAHSPASIEDILDQTVSLIRTIFRMDHIELDIHVQEGLPQIKCRSQQIQQVLMNLLTNARDALNERYPGSCEGKTVFIDASLFLEDGRRWIRIAVEDHGAGIPENIREKIFEPFFSTKPKEKGTGLGLSISFGIVQDHHGRLTVDSDPATGTRFLLELPVDNGWAVEPVQDPGTTQHGRE